MFLLELRSSFALVFFFIGGKVIKWIRKIVRRSFERTGADTGVDAVCGFHAQIRTVRASYFMIATNFGVESSSVAALIASAGVAVGLALQGSLSNFCGRYSDPASEAFCGRRLYCGASGRN